MEKSFTYSADKPYTKKVIGKGPYKIYTTYELVPDLTRYTKAQALSWASRNGVTINFNEVEKPNYPVVKIIAQEYPFRKRVDKIPNKSITVTIVKEGI